MFLLRVRMIWWGTHVHIYYIIVLNQTQNQHANVTVKQNHGCVISAFS